MNAEDSVEKPVPPWTLLTSHGLVLLFVANHPAATIREIAADLQLTERRIADIIRDLSKAGLLSVQREGRRNRYALNPEARFRHPIIANLRFSEFVALSRDPSDGLK